MIPKEAIEAAAEAAYIYHSSEPGFDAEAAWNDMAGAEDWERGQWELEAQAALEAAAPYLRAQALEDAADELDGEFTEMRRAKDKPFAWLCGIADAELHLRARAATERGQA